MKNLLLKIIMVIVISCLSFGLSGCDFIYGLLQREGAEEKKLLGEVVPYERNQKVEEVQKLLKLYGYRIGRADGVLGGNTRRAIMAFQEDNELKVSKFVDSDTWERLNIFTESGLVVEGELNIAAIQRVLQVAGFAPGPIDGKRGRKTDRAIKAFQSAEGLRPDGKVGFKTLSRMVEFVDEE